MGDFKDSSTVFTRRPRPEWLRWDADFFLAVRARLGEALAASVSRSLEAQAAKMIVHGLRGAES